MRHVLKMENSSKENLTYAIKKSVHKNCSFFDLEKNNQIRVLAFIKHTKMNIRVFEEKWYDILCDKFYAMELSLCEENRSRIIKNKIECASFDELYVETNGDIYVKACYFGYRFSTETIRKYSLDLKKLNFDSFIEDTIDNHDYETEIRKPIRYEDWNQYGNDSRAKSPLLHSLLHLNIKKEATDKIFAVTQTWVDEKGENILTRKYDFDYFFDFVHFLKGDLSNTDFLLCEGVDRIVSLPGIKLDNIVVRSDVGERMNMPLKLIPKNTINLTDFDTAKQNEIATYETLVAGHPEDEEHSIKISYVTDIHLEQRFCEQNCRTFEDMTYVLRTIANSLSNMFTRINLIGGDITSNINIFEAFLDELARRQKFNVIFFTLGNHELWNLVGKDYRTTIDRYREIIARKGQGRMFLVQNNIFYFDSGWKEITENELSEIALDDLRSKLRKAEILIFGGIGYSGTNEEFNANNGVYLNSLDRNTEIFESKRFFDLYCKVTAVASDKNLIVFTHMPPRDWAGKEFRPKNGIVYVNGHNHRNYFFDDGKTRIYSDNQVGYLGKRISLKQIAVDVGYNWFADYADGIYEISRDDYLNFYRGIGLYVTFNRKFKQLFMLKRNATYLFLLKSQSGNLNIMNGGALRNANGHTIQYYYDNLEHYAESIRLYLSSYSNCQKEISHWIKALGGYGRIHGCIIDIDFYNHLYLNPLDQSITPYFATSIVDKFVYKNVASLLKYRCPSLYVNFQKLQYDKGTSKALAPLQNDLKLSKRETYVSSTEIYRISRIIKGLQYTTKFSVVRVWNDNLIKENSEQNGQLMLLNLIGSND